MIKTGDIGTHTPPEPRSGCCGGNKCKTAAVREPTRPQDTASNAGSRVADAVANTTKPR